MLICPYCDCEYKTCKGLYRHCMGFHYLNREHCIRDVNHSVTIARQFHAIEDNCFDGYQKYLLKMETNHYYFSVK